MVTCLPRSIGLRQSPSSLALASPFLVLCLLSGWYFSWVIVPAALGTHAPTFQQGLLPEWLGAREVLQGRSPYAQELTKRIQGTIYGCALSPGQGNEHRFAYPVYFAFLFLPVAALPFTLARYLCLAACLTATVFSVRMWVHERNLPRSTVIVAAACVLSTYPVMLGLQLCQPSLLIAGLLSVTAYLARSHRLVSAGMIGALCTAKPQLAIAVLLPLSIWAITGWKSRKQFVLSLGSSVLVLLVASELVIPDWLGQWVTTLQAYSRYAGSGTLLAGLLQGHFVWPAGAALVFAAAWVSWRFCESDLLFAISFSIAVFQLIFPFLLYNEVLLAPAALWLVRRPTAAKGSGQLFELLWSCPWMLLAASATAMAGLSISNLIVPGSGLKLWQLPFAVMWIYPWSMMLVLAAYVLSPQTKAVRAQP